MWAPPKPHCDTHWRCSGAQVLRSSHSPSSLSSASKTTMLTMLIVCGTSHLSGFSIHCPQQLWSNSKTVLFYRHYMLITFPAWPYQSREEGRRQRIGTSAEPSAERSRSQTLLNVLCPTVLMVHEMRHPRSLLAHARGGSLTDCCGTTAVGVLFSACDNGCLGPPPIHLSSWRASPQ